MLKPVEIERLRQEAKETSTWFRKTYAHLFKVKPDGR
jgi:hypothetical protein